MIIAADIAQVKESLVQGYLKDCLACNFVSKQEFLKNFEEMTNGCLKKLDWNNVLVVGGSVLKSVKQRTESPNTANRYNASDVDMYLYGLTKEAAQAKVLQIYKSIQSCWQEKIGIFKTANTITLVSNSEFRNIQIILRYVRKSSACQGLHHFAMIGRHRYLHILINTDETALTHHHWRSCWLLT